MYGVAYCRFFCFNHSNRYISWPTKLQMKFRVKCSYKGALALVCLSVRKNWSKSEMNSDNLLMAALAVGLWPFRYDYLSKLRLLFDLNHCMSYPGLTEMSLTDWPFCPNLESGASAWWWWRVWASWVCGALPQGNPSVHRQHSQRHCPAVGAETFQPPIWPHQACHWYPPDQELVSKSASSLNNPNS